MKDPKIDQIHLKTRLPNGWDWYCEHLTKDSEAAFVAIPMPGEAFCLDFCWECFQNRILALRGEVRA